MKQFLTIIFTITLLGCVKTLDRVNPLDGKSLALLTTTTATSITSTTVVTGGNVYNTGGLAISAKGVAYGLNQNPTTSDNKTNDGSGGAVFTTTISGLTPNTTYYARAYAVNLVGTAYGSQISFKTSAALPSITTNSTSNILNNTATVNSTVQSDNGSPVTARGIVWSTSSSPTILLTTKTKDSSGVGSFVSTMTGLSPLTLYYVRAYATNAIGTSYGAELQVRTIGNPPTITTKAVTNITTTSASIGGDISSDGGATVTARGTVWSTVTGPTTSVTTKTSDGTGIGSFVSNLTGLTAGTRYFARAYATNSTGTSYGAEVKFAYVLAPTMAALPTPAVTTNGANVTATITNDGGGDISSYGFVWSTSSNPTTSSSKVTIGTSTNGIYTNIPLSYSITGLTRNTTYYVRSYATNSAGTSYGTQTSFVIPNTTPTVTTTDPTGLTATTVTIGGNVTDDGGVAVTAKGIVYSTLTGPTTALTTKSSNGTGLGSFTTSISGLTRSTTYYYRAYATNANGTVYGTEKTFVTPAN